MLIAGSLGALCESATVQEACEIAEGEAGEGACNDACKDVTKIVLADEDAADGYHRCPEEHPSAICFEPFRCMDDIRSAESEFRAKPGAEGQAEGVGRVR